MYYIILLYNIIIYYIIILLYNTQKKLNTEQLMIQCKINMNAPLKCICINPLLNVLKKNHPILFLYSNCLQYLYFATSSFSLTVCFGFFHTHKHINMSYIS